ncbi:hypothetical protein CPC08DRAFT_212748 [Agrocybe pediades]|nr:hypothetical protein CPC08DRAFT_212748 [Agrocybe pediades]
MLFEAIVLNDPTLSYIQDHQLGILRSVLMQQIQQYFRDDRQALVLVLFYHLGSHRFIPILKTYPLPYWYSNPFYLGAVYDGDILSLSRMWELPFGGNDIYHHYVHQLLCDPDRPTKYALGPNVYERATLACFKELASTVLLLPSPFGRNIDIASVTDDGEDDTYPKLSFNSMNGGQWQFKYSGAKWTLDDEELFFVLLGYLIFLLPRCGRSEALGATCEEHRTYIGQSEGPFPVRRRLLHKEINNYLARVHINNFVCMTQ